MSGMTPIQPDTLPLPRGHYTPGMQANGFVFVSGQLPTNPATGEVPEGIEAQSERCLRNVELVLQAAGSGLDRVVSMTVYIVDADLWATFNQVAARVFGDHRPSRAVIPVRDFHFGALLEIQAIALA